jgi:hypothetical protein
MFAMPAKKANMVRSDRSVPAGDHSTVTIFARHRQDGRDAQSRSL